MILNREKGAPPLYSQVETILRTDIEHGKYNKGDSFPTENMLMEEYQVSWQNNDKAFRWMWLTIVLSFGFYIPVVLWADVTPLIGMLMIPKTCAYVWTVLIGYNAMKAETGKQN